MNIVLCNRQKKIISINFTITNIYDNALAVLKKILKREITQEQWKQIQINENRILGFPNVDEIGITGDIII
jgi:hypothetical protein